MEALLPLIIQAVAGAAGGAGIAASIKNVALNGGLAALLGAVGGVGGGSVLGGMIGAAAGWHHLFEMHTSYVETGDAITTDDRFEQLKALYA